MVVGHVLDQRLVHWPTGCQLCESFTATQLHLFVCVLSTTDLASFDCIHMICKSKIFALRSFVGEFASSCFRFENDNCE